MHYDSTVQHQCQHVSHITKKVQLPTIKMKTSKMEYMYSDVSQWH